MDVVDTSRYQSKSLYFTALLARLLATCKCSAAIIMGFLIDDIYIFSWPMFIGHEVIVRNFVT